MSEPRESTEAGAPDSDAGDDGAGAQMIVKDLIAALKTMPANAVVVGRGYEDGYDDVFPPRLVEVVDSQGPGEKTAWWTGRYDDVDYQEGEPIAVVVIS